MRSFVISTMVRLRVVTKWQVAWKMREVKAWPIKVSRLAEINGGEVVKKVKTLKYSP
jgi:hypothetical protein